MERWGERGEGGWEERVREGGRERERERCDQTYTLSLLQIQPYILLHCTNCVSEDCDGIRVWS